MEGTIGDRIDSPISAFPLQRPTAAHALPPIAKCRSRYRALSQRQGAGSEADLTFHAEVHPSKHRRATQPCASRLDSLRRHKCGRVAIGRTGDSMATAYVSSSSAAFTTAACLASYAFPIVLRRCEQAWRYLGFAQNRDRRMCSCSKLWHFGPASSAFRGNLKRGQES